MRAVEAALAAFKTELGSNRDPDSVRGRLHVVENTNAAADAARAALDAAARERAAAEQAREERGHRRLSTWQTAIGLGLALLTVVPTVVGSWMTLLALLHKS